MPGPPSPNVSAQATAGLPVAANARTAARSSWARASGSPPPPTRATSPATRSSAAASRSVSTTPRSVGRRRACR